jgi:thiol-disulfide isomerase/thioredoxin
MLRIAFLIVTTLCFLGCASSTAQHSSTHRPELHVGEITSADLLATYPVFAEEYHRSEPSEDALDKMRALEGKSLVVLFGTWCHDSEREVPRLLKLIDRSGVKLDTLQLVAVDYNKADPNGVAVQYNLRYTATIIVKDQHKELGRIVERPKVSLADDFWEMVQP